MIVGGSYGVLLCVCDRERESERGKGVGKVREKEMRWDWFRERELGVRGSESERESCVRGLIERGRGG